MKKKSMGVWTVLFFISVLLAADDTVKILPLEIPTDRSSGANTLLADLTRLDKIGDELASGMLSGNIILLDRQGSPLATLGNLKKGKIKWENKTGGGKFLAFKLPPVDYVLLAEVVKARQPLDGFRIAICDETTFIVNRSFPVAFSDFADLAVQLNYPVEAAIGQSLRQQVSVILENKGTVAARNIKLEIVLSSDTEIPLRSAPAAAAYGEDILLENGSETIAALEPGQQVTVNFSGSLKIPEDTPPGKYYLAVVVDPENRIGELSEENNIYHGYIMIDVPEPAAFNVELPETVLHFEPVGFGFKIVWFDTLLSDGKDWKLCKMQPNLYQIKHVSWTDFYWEIDTYERAVWEVSGADFCRKGGKARDLKIKVEVSGGSLHIPPSRFILKLQNTRVRFEPAAKKFILQSYERPICHLPFWWVCKRESSLFQIRYVLWQDFFWQVDIFRKKADRMTGGKFCSSEGTGKIMPVVVTVEQ